MQQQARSEWEELLASSEKYAKRQEELLREEQEEKQEPRKELVLRTSVAGIHHWLDFGSVEDRGLLQTLTPGTLLTLRREPENAYDRWAVEVYTPGGRKVGYMTRYKNETIARMMDNGHSFEAIVEEETDTPENDTRDQMAPTEQGILS